MVQGKACAACGTEVILEATKNDKRLGHLDHNHQSGQVRGILCSKCNHALGLLDDSIEKIQKLLSYLKQYEG